MHTNTNTKIMKDKATRSVMSPTIYMAAGEFQDTSLNLYVFEMNVIKKESTTMFNKHQTVLGKQEPLL